MNNLIILKIRKLTQSGWLLLLMLLMPFCFGILNELLHLPWAIRYLLDVALIVLLGMMIRSRAYTGNWSSGVLGIWVLLFLIFTALQYVLRYQSPLYYLWGVRNNFRFFVAFFAFTIFLYERDVVDYFKLLDILFWISILVSLYQYFAIGLNGDHLGGLFSTEAGGNGYTNIFFLIVLTKGILFYIEKKEKFSTCVLKCVAALFVAALAELKFFFVEFVVIVALASVFTKFTWRKLLVIGGGTVAVVTFAALLVTVFPNFEGFFSLDWFMEAGGSDKGYTSAGDLNRLNAISKINELWLKTPWQRLFGLGLGNCDTSGFAIVNTPFFEAYGDMHYTWLSYAMIYLETGWIGLIFYYGFFVLVYFGARRIEKRSDGIAKTYCRMSRILAIMCMIIAVYNSSLRTEAGYMMFFALAIPFALDKVCPKIMREK